MRRSSPLAVACLAALAMVLPALPSHADSAFGVTAKLTFLGNLGPGGEPRYRYDYTVTNVAIEPELGALQVFYNSDPVTQLPSGDKATFVSYAAPLGWEAVTVMPKNPDGQWSVNWDWDYATLSTHVPPGASLGGFSVVFDWSDPSTVPPLQLAQARNGTAHDGIIEVPPSQIAGTVVGTCGADPVGLQGITVDLFAVDGQGQETLLASTATGPDGSFLFANLALGTYDVVIVTPLGYVANANSQLLTITETGATFDASFSLACQNIAAEPRTIGYWKHQVNVYLTGKGSAQESLAQMLGYIDLILEHFNQNITNPVLIYVPASNSTSDELTKLQQLLTVNKNGTMLDRAKQQLLALLLNVVSGKISQTQVISGNGATVSQAITYCNDLIQDGLTGNDETAKTIADLINNGQPVPAGMVPSSTRIITYRLQPQTSAGVAFRLDPAFPNPARGVAVSIGFAMSREGAVDLRVFDVNGRAVKSLARGSFGAGVHRLVWDGTSDAGAAVSPGVYFYRIVTDEGASTRSVTFQR